MLTNTAPQLRLDLCNPSTRMHLICKTDGLKTMLKGEIFLAEGLDTVEISVYNLSKPLKIILDPKKVWDVMKNLLIFGKNISVNQSKDSELRWANLTQPSIIGHIDVGFCNNLNINFALAAENDIIDYTSYSLQELLDIFDFNKVKTKKDLIGELIETSEGRIFLPITLRLLNIRKEIIFTDDTIDSTG